MINRALELPKTELKMKLHIDVLYLEKCAMSDKTLSEIIKLML